MSSNPFKDIAQDIVEALTGPDAPKATPLISAGAIEAARQAANAPSFGAAPKATLGAAVAELNFDLNPNRWDHSKERVIYQEGYGLHLPRWGNPANLIFEVRLNTGESFRLVPGMSIRTQFSSFSFMLKSVRPLSTGAVFNVRFVVDKAPGAFFESDAAPATFRAVPLQTEISESATWTAAAGELSSAVLNRLVYPYGYKRIRFLWETTGGGSMGDVTLLPWIFFPSNPAGGAGYKFAPYPQGRMDFPLVGSILAFDLDVQALGGRYQPQAIDAPGVAVQWVSATGAGTTVNEWSFAVQ